MPGTLPEKFTAAVGARWHKTWFAVGSIAGTGFTTPALTTRGMKEPEMLLIAAWIAKALELRNDDAALEHIRQEVAELANQFPLYAWRRNPVAVAG